MQAIQKPDGQWQWVYRATLIEVKDGDTITVRLDHGRRIYSECEIRFLGINAAGTRHPEAKDAAEIARGLMAKQHLISLLSIAKWGLQVQTELDRRGDDEDDKYGRLLGTIWVNGLNVNEAMLKSGHAAPYDGR